MKTIRALLILTGTSFIALAVVGLLKLLTPPQWESLGAWLVGALFLHDGVLAPATLLVGAALWRAGRPLPITVSRIITGGFVVAGVLTLFALPVIHREGVKKNSTLLFMDYRQHLWWLLLATALVTGLAAASAAYFSRRRSTAS